VVSRGALFVAQIRMRGRAEHVGTALCYAGGGLGDGPKEPPEPDRSRIIINQVYYASNAVDVAGSLFVPIELYARSLLPIDCSSALFPEIALVINCVSVAIRKSYIQLRRPEG